VHHHCTGAALARSQWTPGSKMGAHFRMHGFKPLLGVSPFGLHREGNLCSCNNRSSSKGKGPPGPTGALHLLSTWAARGAHSNWGRFANRLIAGRSGARRVDARAPLAAGDHWPPVRLRAVRLASSNGELEAAGSKRQARSGKLE